MEQSRKVLHYILCKCHQLISGNRAVWGIRRLPVDSLRQRRHLACLLLTHHCDVLSLDADIRAPEVAQSGNSSNASSIHQVPVMIQHVNIHPDLPHLNTETHITTISLNIWFFSVFCFLFCVCVFYLFPRHHTQGLGINALGVPQASLQLPV